MLALDSLFGEFLNAEGMNEVDAASNCDLHTRFVHLVRMLSIEK